MDPSSNGTRTLEPWSRCLNEASTIPRVRKTAKKRCRSVKMYKTDGISWSVKEYTINGFLDCYKKLPQLVKVSQGFHGDYLVDCIGTDEILWIHSFSNQRRVLGKDSRGQPLSIPYDYHIRLILVQDANPAYPPMSLRKLLELHELPFNVRLPGAEKAVWQDDEADDLGIIHLESQFEHRHLLVSCVLVDKLDTRVRMLPTSLSQIRFVVAEGFATGDKSAWKEFKSELNEAAGKMDIDGISGTSDMAMYAHSTASKAEQLIPTRFVTVRKTETARKRSISEGTVKETNMVGQLRDMPKELYQGAMVPIDDLNERLKKWKTRAEGGRQEGTNNKELSAEEDSSVDEKMHRNNYERIQVSKDELYLHTSLTKAESLDPQERYTSRPKRPAREIKPEEELKGKSAYEIVAVGVGRVIPPEATNSPKYRSVYQSSPKPTDKTSKLKQENVPKGKPQVAAKPKSLSQKRPNLPRKPASPVTGRECITESVDMSSPIAKPQIAVLPLLAENTSRDIMTDSINNFSSIRDIPVDISSLSSDDISKCLRFLNLDESIISVFKEKQLDGAFLSMIQKEQLRKFLQDETAISVIDTERTVSFFKKAWRPA